MIIRICVSFRVFIIFLISHDWQINCPSLSGISESLCCDTLRIFHIVNRYNIRSGSFSFTLISNTCPDFVHIRKFRRDESQPQIMSHCRKYHIRRRKLHIRCKCQTILFKIFKKEHVIVSAVRLIHGYDTSSLSDNSSFPAFNSSNRIPAIDLYPCIFSISSSEAALPPEG